MPSTETSSPTVGATPNPETVLNVTVIASIVLPPVPMLHPVTSDPVLTPLGLSISRTVSLVAALVTTVFSVKASPILNTGSLMDT